MRLQQLVPPLDAHFVDILSSINVKTDIDLLLASTSDGIFARLPPGHGISLKAFRAHVVHATQLLAAPATYGDALLAQDLKRRADMAFADDADMPVGVAALDELLGGGFAPPCVVEISGDVGSGKTVSSEVISSLAATLKVAPGLAVGTGVASRASPPRARTALGGALDRQ